MFRVFPIVLLSQELGDVAFPGLNEVASGQCYRLVAGADEPLLVALASPTIQRVDMGLPMRIIVATNGFPLAVVAEFVMPT